MRRLAGAVVLLALASPASAGTWYINPDGTGDATTIQAGVDMAVSGDIVSVAPGTYTDFSTRSVGDPISACVFMKQGVAVLGEGGPAVTIIDAQGQAEVGVVFFVANGAELTGFTVMGATDELVFCIHTGRLASVRGNRLLGVGLSSSLRCIASSPVIQDNYFDGRGMYLDGSDPVITNNVVIGTDAAFATGVTWIDGYSSGQLEGNLFVNCKNAGVNLVKDSPPVIGNTIVGCRNGILSDRTQVDFRRNVIVDSWQNGIFTDEVVGTAIVECNDVWNSANGNDYTGEVPDQTGMNGNFSADPLFCNSDGGSYYLQWGSPCLPANSDGCGLVGVYGFGGCNSVAVTQGSWGRLKARFRSPTEDDN